MTTPTKNKELDPNFLKLTDEIYQIGRDWHTERLLRHAEQNKPRIQKTVRDLAPPTGEKAKSAVVLSAGPSVHKKKQIAQLKASGYKGSIIAADGALIACLKEGLVPDYVLTLDPHITRVVAWFGGGAKERLEAKDDYYSRQDLNEDFRRNLFEVEAQHIALVNEYGPRIKAIPATTAPDNVARRIGEARFDTYWWNPLMDDPKQPDSLTRKMYAINKIPCMNTGGNVGTASWVFATTILKIPHVALCGMDFGYYHDTPINMTQLYYELVRHLQDDRELEGYFPKYTFPLNGEKYYTDPTYFWYRKNFIELLEKAPGQTYNCTEGGTLIADKLKYLYLRDFVEQMRN